MKARDLIREARRRGWSVTRTGGDHLRLEHRQAAGPFFTGSTPSDFMEKTLAEVLAAQSYLTAVKQQELPPVAWRPGKGRTNG